MRKGIQSYCMEPYLGLWLSGLSSRGPLGVRPGFGFEIEDLGSSPHQKCLRQLLEQRSTSHMTVEKAAPHSKVFGLPEHVCMCCSRLINPPSPNPKFTRRNLGRENPEPEAATGSSNARSPLEDLRQEGNKRVPCVASGLGLTMGRWAFIDS